MEQDATGEQPAEPQTPSTAPGETGEEHGSSSPVEMAKEKLEEVKDKLAPKLGEAKDKIGPKLGEAKEKIGPKVEEAGKKLGPALEKLKGMVKQLLGKLRKNPPPS